MSGDHKSEILRVKDLTFTRGKKTILKDISFSLKKGEILALAGKSGSGKTTLLSALSGLWPAGCRLEKGEILIDGSLCAQSGAVGMAPEASRLSTLIFQDGAASFNPVRTIGSQIDEMLRYDPPQDASSPAALDLLPSLFLEMRDLKRYPSELSGGMAQRMCVLAALLKDAPLILADEPTASLDSLNRRQMAQIFTEIKKKGRAGMIIATHDIGFFRLVADTVLLLEDGRVAELDEAADFFAHPASDEAKALLAADPSALIQKRNGGY